MKIPHGADRVLRQVTGGSSAVSGTPAQGAGSGSAAFRQILESRLSALGVNASGRIQDGAPDDVRIRQIIDIIKLRMMLDEHLLGFMRGGDGDLSLYRRFARWQWTGPGMTAADPLGTAAEKAAGEGAWKTAGTTDPVAAGTARTAEQEISSVVKLPKKAERAPAYEPLIQEASKTYGVEPELIRAVIRAESNFRNESTSPRGAMGLMQLMPQTAKELGVRDAYDPRENIMGGTRYLKGLLDRYRGDVPTALAAYNWGMGNVERRPEQLPRETRVYIDRVQRFMNEGKA